MIKLRDVIQNLDSATYESVQNTLLKNKADNFLFLLQAYRGKEIKDKEIIEKLDINSNAFYVLKSRLHDKIQEFLSGNIHATKEEVLRQLHQIPEMCVNASREICVTFLQKLEKDLLMYDMHSELIVVYSALKKVHTYSERYFHYSQLYNKHVAFSLSLEKSHEILGNFNRTLGQYNFSRSSKLLDMLMFLKKAIAEHDALNPSKPIELIQNLIELQLRLLAGIESDEKHSTQDLLLRTQKLISEFPESSVYKNWSIAVDYLYFEYYHKIGQAGPAQIYFEKVNAGFNTLLLSTHICVSSLFLMSKITYLQKTNRLDLLKEEYHRQILFDSSDVHTVVLTGIYHALIAFYMGKFKEASTLLNELLNINSFKDYFHINTEIKLTLAYIYLQLEEFDVCDHIIKSVYRKIKSEKQDTYTCLLDLIKVFGEDIKKQNTKVTSKQKDNYTLFMARNKGESKILNHLMFEFNTKYA